MASKRHVRQHQCGDKIKHDSKEFAYAHRRDMKKNGHNERLDVYQCPFCHKWHIGHHPKNHSVSQGNG